MNDLSVPMITPNHGLDFTNPSCLEAAQKSCSYLTESDLVPPSYSAAKVGPKKAAANTLIMLDYSLRLGVPPLAMMQELAVVNGHPSLSAKFLTSIVNSCGRFETIKYNKGTLEGGVLKDGVPVTDKNGKPIQNLFCYAYTWEITKWNSKEEKDKNCLKSSLVTMQMAVDEGWYFKAGSKWQTMPSQMLMYRAASFWCRAYAPELSLGMISTEEAQDIGSEEAEIIDMEDSAISSPSVDPIEAAANRIKAENEARAKAMEQASGQFQAENK